MKRHNSFWSGDFSCGGVRMVWRGAWLLLALCLLSLNVTASSPVPVITSVVPNTGQIGSVVTINGANFDPAANNAVYFGPVKATVKSVTATRLVVSVPAGAAYAPITETVDSLTAYSPQPFSPGFLGNGGNLATNSFSSQIPVNAGTIQSSVALADLDGDGRADLITANYAANSISIYQNVSTNSAIGTNSFAPPLTISLGAEVSDVAVGDLDGDGRLDLVVCSPTGVLFILQNTSTNGVISFANAFTIPAPDNSRVSLIRDIDGDGKSDLVVPSYGDSVLAVYQNVSVPGLLSEDSFAAPVDFPIPSGAFTIAVGDLNGDGKPDLVTANGVAVSIFRNTATVGVIDANSFATRIDLAHPAAGVAVADIDGDGLSDLVTADQNNNSITVLRNTTTALNNITFAPGVSFPTGFNTYWVSVADLNGDGFPDVVAGSENGTGVAIFQNAAVPGNSLTNSLQPPVILNGGVGPHEVVIGDLDGDGRMDIVVNNFGSTYLSIFQNRAPFAGVPTFTLEPTNEVVTFGGNTAFTVAALGSTDLSYQWSFNGTNIAGGTSAVLPITNAQFTNIGTYFVTVSNAYGTATSSIVSLSMPALIITQPASITNDFGSTAVFTVVAGGSAPIDYQWLFNGTNLLGQTNATLTLPNVQTNVAGIYSVAVSNVFGGALSSGATLTVIGAPIIVTQPAAQTVKPGNSASFSVGAIGAGVLQYQWYFNGNAISGATNTVFTLNGVQVANAGFYSVVVSNALGSVTSSNAGLTVNAIPVITSFTPGFAINGATVTITGVNFSPTPTNNIVYFGAVRATVSAASPTNLVVSVPVGATTEPITETVGGLTAYSSKSFVPTFVGNGAPIARTNFGAAVNFAAPIGQTFIAVADLDGDGRPDLITANLNGGSISIYRNLSTSGTITQGTLAAPITIPLLSGLNHVAVGDLNGDGLLDLAASAYNSGVVCVLQNTSTPGNISFAPYFTLAASGSSATAAIRDIDGDGHPDLILAGESGPVISVYQNLGATGTLSVASFAPRVDFAGVGQPVYIVTADLNNDGKTDLIVGDNSAVSVFRNTSTLGIIDTNSFGPRIDIDDAAYCVTVGDIDGDGLPDIITGDQSANTMSVFRNTTTSVNNITFAQPASFSTSGSYEFGVCVGDLNGDGKLDIVATTPLNASILVFQNESQTGAVSFGPPVILPSAGGVRQVALVDLDGDGRLDLAAPNLENSTGFTVYQNLVPLGTAPVIVTEPVSQGAVLGQSINFSVTATGAQPLSYQWSFDGTNIAGATNSLLSLANVQTNLLGSYAVTVTNFLGIAVSSNAILSALQVPVITSFSPRSGTNGSVVNISGINFDPTPTNNIVYFGAVRATVSDASSTNLVVTVPTGAIYAPITETVRGLTAFSDTLFLPVFQSGGTLSSNSFGPQIVFTAGSGPSLVVSGDLDGDGKPDVVVANVYDGTVYIYRNVSTNGQLTSVSFASPVIFTIGGGGDSVWGLGLADLDGDGRMDIVVANRNLNIVSIFQNLSSPGSLTTSSFAARVDLPVAGNPRGIAVIDLDGDGRPEIITANSGSNIVSVFQNLGQPGLITTNSFGPPINFAFGTSPDGVLAADIDGDGKPDLIGVGPTHSSTLSILRNTSTAGTVSFAPKLDIAGLGGGDSAAVGDLDGDGKLDLVYAAGSGQAVSVYQNISTLGNISFASPVSVSTGGWANSVAIGDLDGDGRPDLVVSKQAPSKLSIFKNISTIGSLTASSFGTRIDLAAASNANGIAIDDFDGDGRPDIAFGNSSSGVISLYENVIPFDAPPVITTQPISQTVLLGESTSISVAAAGVSPLSYQWSFGGTNIVGATNAVLILNPVVLTSAGSYSVVVSNLFGFVTSSNAILIVTLPPPCDPPPVGLVAWWQAEGNADDSVGGNNGIPIGNLGYTNGEVGRAFVFDGSTSYIPLPASTSLDLGADVGLTIECWIKPNYSESAAMPIVEWDSTQANGLTLFAESGHSLYGAILDGVGNIHELRSANDSLSTTVWQHVAFTYDKISGVALLYVNGNIVATNNFGSIVAQTAYPLNIGRRAATVTGSGLTYNGLLDELSLYNRALSGAEIMAVYGAGSGGKCVASSPLIIIQPTNEIVKVGTQTNFAVMAAGTSPLRYQWSFDGTNIDGATNAVLNLNPVLLLSAGTYSVAISNLFGSVYSSNGVLTVYAQDHFAWSNILSPRFLNVPFTVTIQAQSLSNGVVTNFTGTVLLSSTNGIPIDPPVSASFSNGLWTGSVVISELVTNLVLRADDGLGEFGSANPINIMSQPALTASVSGGFLVIYWPTAVPKFILETSPSLAPPNWTQVSTSPVQIINQYLVSLSIGQTNCFYRLRYVGP